MRYVLVYVPTNRHTPVAVTRTSFKAMQKTLDEVIKKGYTIKRIENNVRQKDKATDRTSNVCRIAVGGSDAYLLLVS